MIIANSSNFKFATANTDIITKTSSKDSVFNLNITNLKTNNEISEGEDVLASSVDKINNLKTQSIDINEGVRPKKDNDTIFSEIRFSSSYVEHNTQQLITLVEPLFEKWKNSGTLESISEITEIKNLLEKYSRYLKFEAESNILLGILEILFVDDNWERLDAGKLNLILTELRKFNNGEISWESLNGFSKQLWEGKIFPKKELHEE